MEKVRESQRKLETVRESVKQEVRERQRKSEKVRESVRKREKV